MRELLVNEKGVFRGLHTKSGRNLFASEEELRNNPDVIQDSIKQDRERWARQLQWFSICMKEAIADFEEAAGERLSCLVLMGVMDGKPVSTRKFRDGGPLPARFLLDSLDGNKRIDSIRVYQNGKGEAEIHFYFDHQKPFIGHLYFLTKSQYGRFKKTKDSRSIEDFVQEECRRMKMNPQSSIQQVADTHLENVDVELVGQFW